jgi:hypothetical protein
VDQHQDVGWGVGSPDADVVEATVDAQGDAFGLVVFSVSWGALAKWSAKIPDRIGEDLRLRYRWKVTPS